MKVEIERHDYDCVLTDGEHAKWAGEVIRIQSGNTTYRFDLSDSNPGEAIFAWIDMGPNGGTYVDMTTAHSPICRAMPRGSPLLRHAVQWIRDFRAIQSILVGDCRTGVYCRLAVADLA